VFCSAIIALLALWASSNSLIAAPTSDFAFKCVMANTMMTFRGHDGQVCIGAEAQKPVSPEQAAHLRCLDKERVDVSDNTPPMFTWPNLGGKTRLFLDTDHSRLLETDLDGNNSTTACHPLLALDPN
jgi:hypothetical protein